MTLSQERATGLLLSRTQ